MKKLLDKYTGFCRKYAKAVVVLPLFVITQGLYLFMVLKSIPAVKKFSEGLELPDLMPTGYSADYIPKLLKTLGEEGRSVYMSYQIPLDMIYPLLFAISYSILLAYLFKKGISDTNILNRFVVVPVFAAVFDYCENLAVLWQLKTFPETSEVLSTIAGIATVFKSGFTSLFFLLLFIGIAAMMIRRVRKASINS